MNTLIKGTEAACGTDAAGASTFGSATVVRLVNNSTTARLVTVIDEVGVETQNEVVKEVRALSALLYAAAIKPSKKLIPSTIPS